MKKKIAFVGGILAGGIALAGLTGSAFAGGEPATAKPTGPAAGRDVVVCIHGGGPKHVKVKPGTAGKGTGPIDAHGKVALPPAGKVVIVTPDGKVGTTPPRPPKDAAKIITRKAGSGPVKIKPGGKGVKCFRTAPGAPGLPGTPGTPGAPTPVPAR